MNDTHSTAAAAVIDAEPVPDTQMQTVPQGSAPIVAWSPEQFALEVKRDEQMRTILREYVQRNMKLGHHYYTELGSTKLEKPALKQEGAHNIASLFKLIFGPPLQEEKWFDDGHYQAKTTIDIFNANGERIATGIGICTTRESKYRWRKESRTCPDCGAAAIFKDNRSPQGGWYCWAKRDGCGAKFAKGDASIEDQKIGRVENIDLADSYNTVAKMSLKRAKVGGICQVPLVSEIFVPDDDDDDDAPAPVRGNGPAKAQQNQPAPQQQQSRPPQSQTTFVEKAVELSQKLVMNHNVEPEDLSVQFLPEDVRRFEDLTEEQAQQIVPGLIELLNTKLTEKK